MRHTKRIIITERLMNMRKAIPAMFLALLLLLCVSSAQNAASAEAPPAGPYLNPNQKAAVGSWEIQVSTGMKWTKEIKGDKPQEASSSSSGQKQPQMSAKENMTFALVPVTIKNMSDRTASLLLAVWNFYDYTGRSYVLLTVGLDFLPSSERISLADFKPGETRKGFLPFELPEGLDKKDKYMQVIIPLVGSATWKL